MGTALTGPPVAAITTTQEIKMIRALSMGRGVESKAGNEGQRLSSSCHCPHHSSTTTFHIKMSKQTGEAFKNELKANKPKFGIFVNGASPVIAEQLSYSGYDWLLVDMQHGNYYEEHCGHNLYFSLLSRPHGLCYPFCHDCWYPQRQLQGSGACRWLPRPKRNPAVA
jgi:hypothetical protein